MAEEQAVFAAARHHAIRLIRAFRDEIVNERPDVGFVALQDEGLAALDFERRVDAGHETLGSGFLVAGRAVRLAGGVEPRDFFELQRRQKLQRIDEIVLDRVGRAHDFYIFQPGNRPQKRVLHIDGKRRRHPLHIHFIRVRAFGLHKKLVAILVGEADDFILNRRAIARADAVDFSGKHRSAVEIFADDAMRFLIRVREIAIAPVPVFGVVQKGKRMVPGIARFDLHMFRAKRTPVDAARRACLETQELDTVFP